MTSRASDFASHNHARVLDGTRLGQARLRRRRRPANPHRRTHRTSRGEIRTPHRRKFTTRSQFLNHLSRQRGQRRRTKHPRFRRRRRAPPLILQIHVGPRRERFAKLRVFLNHLPFACSNGYRDRVQRRASVAMVQTKPKPYPGVWDARDTPKNCTICTSHAPKPYRSTPRMSASFSTSVHARYPFRLFFLFCRIHERVTRRNSSVIHPSRRIQQNLGEIRGNFHPVQPNPAHDATYQRRGFGHGGHVYQRIASLIHSRFRRLLRHVVFVFVRRAMQSQSQSQSQRNAWARHCRKARPEPKSSSIDLFIGVSFLQYTIPVYPYDQPTDRPPVCFEGSRTDSFFVCFWRERTNERTNADPIRFIRSDSIRSEVFPSLRFALDGLNEKTCTSE